jgi:hypothetical protein
MTQFRFRTLSLLPALAFAAAGAAQEHDLRSTAKKGTVAHFLQTTKQEQAIDMDGQTMDMGNTVHYALKLAVTDVAEGGNLTVEVHMLRVHGVLVLPMMGEVEFDSTKPAGEDDGFGMGALGDAMTSLAGKKFSATVTPFGKVDKVEGLDAILEEARNKGGQMGGQMLAGSLSEDALQGIVNNAFGVLPEAPIGVGKTWTKEEAEKARRTPVQNKMEMTLTSFGDEAFEIETKGTVEKAAGDGPSLEGMEGEEAAMAKEMMAGLKIKNGKIAGKQKVSRKDGLMVESSSVISMDLEMPNPMGGGDMVIAMKTTMTTKRCTEAEAMPKKAEEKKEGADKETADKK